MFVTWKIWFERDWNQFVKWRWIFVWWKIVEVNVKFQAENVSIEKHGTHIMKREKWLATKVDHQMGHQRKSPAGQGIVIA